MKVGKRQSRLISRRAALARTSSALRIELHQIIRNTGRVMSRYISLFQIIAKHRNHSQRFDGFEIGHNLARSFKGILGLKLIGDRSAVDQSVIEDLLMRMTIERADVIGGGKPQAFIRLGH